MSHPVFQQSKNIHIEQEYETNTATKKKLVGTPSQYILSLHFSSLCYYVPFYLRLDLNFLSMYYRSLDKSSITDSKLPLIQGV